MIDYIKATKHLQDKDNPFLGHCTLEASYSSGWEKYYIQGCERLEISDICSALHYNKSYIFKQFKKSTNSSVMSYFMKLKVEKAKELLRETSMSISEIASYLSFDTSNYFSKIFKKVTGYTPTTYRKMRRKKQTI